MKTFLTILFTIIGLNIATAGGGWPQPKGQGYFKLGQSLLRADQFYTLSGDLLDITTTSVYITSLYVEYGITDRLTGLLNAPLFVRSTINKRESTINGQVAPGDEFDGFGDVDLGIKYGILTDGPIVLSASLLLGLPTGTNVGGNSELLQTGDGEFNQLLRLEASKSFPKASLYATLMVGYNNRTKADFAFSIGEETDVPFSNEFHWGGEVGWTPSDKWLLALKWRQVISLGNGQIDNRMNNSSLFGNNVEYFAFAPEVNYTFANNFGISVSLATAMGGQNILAAPNYGFGVYYLLK